MEKVYWRYFPTLLHSFTMIILLALMLSFYVISALFVKLFLEFYLSTFLPFFLCGCSLLNDSFRVEFITFCDDKIIGLCDCEWCIVCDDHKQSRRVVITALFMMRNDITLTGFE